MDGIDTSGQALVDHWKWAVEKGQMNSNTGNALKAACTQVLSVADGWRTLDVRAMDVDDVFRRFQNKKGKEYSTTSLSAYKRRFGQAVKLFLDYANNPASWKFAPRERTGRRERPPASASNVEVSTATPERPAAPPVVSGLVEYPFPLREGRFAYLRLPADLKLAEVKRLTAYLQTLAVDAEVAA